MIIKKPKDWWNLVDLEWENLYKILWSFLPMEYVLKAEQAKTIRNWEGLYNQFQSAWAAAPDEPSIHRIPGWGSLCDLCSEIWVFDDEREN